MIDSLLNFDFYDTLVAAPSFIIYAVTFLALLINGVINVPSSQIAYLTLGYLSNVSNFNIYVAVLLGAVGNTLGNYILYRSVYNNSESLNSGIIKYLNVNKITLEKYSVYFRGKWWGFLILGKLTPSIKVFVPIICGLSKITKIKSVLIFSIGSVLWAIMVTSIGSHFGKQASLLQFFFIVLLIYIFVGAVLYYKNQNK